MHRRSLYGAILGSLFLALTGRLSHAQTGNSADKVTLRDTLEKGLKARRRSEFEFIDRVVGLVDQGILSRSSVQKAFQYARKQRNHPFQRFERVIKVEARRQRVPL